ncbi:hypothetical protein ACMFMG_005076 [Clarireedia jacksonii]
MRGKLHGECMHAFYKRMGLAVISTRLPGSAFTVNCLSLVREIIHQRMGNGEIYLNMKGMSRISLIWISTKIYFAGARRLGPKPSFLGISLLTPTSVSHSKLMWQGFHDPSSPFFFSSHLLHMDPGSLVTFKSRDNE